MIIPIRYVENSLKNWEIYDIKNQKRKKKKKQIELLREKPAVSSVKFIIYKITYVIIHFVIIIVSYLALIRLIFVELGFGQIKK